jgi:hypothetical protein
VTTHNWEEIDRHIVELGLDNFSTIEIIVQQCKQCGKNRSVNEKWIAVVDSIEDTCEEWEMRQALK